MWFYISLGVVLVILIYAFVIYNRFIHLTNRIEEAFSTMDVYLKKRWDLIPNLVEVTKGYAKHEKETFEAVVKARKGSYDSLSTEEKIKTNAKIAQGISHIMVLAENYPELKADKNFQQLSQELVQVEDDIATSRKYYNGVVRLYNNKVEMFPSNILAKMFGYQTKKMFEITESEKENVKVSL